MSLFASAVFEIGAVSAKYILKLWLKDSYGDDIASSLVDLLKSKTSDVFIQNKGRRQFEEIGDRIGESLLPMFEQEGGLDQGDRLAVADTVKEALSRAKLSSEVLIQRNLDPGRLAQYIIDAYPTAMRGFSTDATVFYERIIKETCTYIVDIASQLPAFTERSFAEVLRREDNIIAIANKIFEDLQNIRKNLDPTLKSQQFEIEYRQAVARNLDILQLIGADVSLPNRRHQLSVAYITLSVEQKQPPTLPLEPEYSFSHSQKQSLKLPSGYGLSRSRGQKEIHDIVSVHTALAASRRVLIRGIAGSGKTTLLQWVAVRAATKSFDGELADWNASVPFYIRLRHYAQTELPGPELFPALVAKMIIGDMPPNWVRRALQSGRAIVLIDGVDEVPLSRREEVHSWLNDLVETYSQARFLVTSRPHAIQDGWMNHNPFHDAELQPLELADIEAFIDHWHQAVREELQTWEERNELQPLAADLKERIKLYYPLRRLATNPLLCAMFCALNRDRRQHLPVNRIELYRACCELLLERREKENRIDLSDYPALSLSQKERILQYLAYWMIQTNLSEAEAVQVDKCFAEQLEHMPNLSQDITGSAVRRLFVERAGIIREPVVDYVDFTHRTFEEFLAAQAAVQEEDIEQLVAQAHSDQWREVIILAAGLASKAASEQLITGIIKRGDGEKKHRHALHLLALSCLETVIQLRPEVQTEIDNRLHHLIPPKNMTEAKAIAATGELAVKHLIYRKNWPASISSLCVRILTLIRSDTALSTLESYIDDTDEPVRKELLKAWDAFDRSAFGKSILSRLSSLKSDSVSSLEGIQYAVHLISVDFSGCHQLSDFSPLASLGSLTTLNLSGCRQLPSLSPFANLSSLTTLDLSKCERLMDLSPLANLSSLTTLNLSECELLMDLSPLANLSSLTTLNLSGCRKLPSLSPLANLSSLTTLDLSNCEQLMDLSPFANLSSLTTLDLSKCEQLTDLSPLASLSTLVILNLSECERLMDLSPLASLSSLTTLTLSRCGQLTDISPLASLSITSLSELTTLNLSQCEQLTTLSLAGLNKLTILNLSQCGQLTTLSLAGLSKLTILNLSRCGRLTDLSSLTSLSSLTTLDLSWCRRLTTLSLVGLSKLTTLNLSKCGQLTTLSLVCLSKLTILDLSWCGRLTTLSLVGLSKLTTLDLSGCEQLPDFSFLASLSKLTTLNLSLCRQLTDLSPLAGLSKLTTLNLSRCFRLITLSPLDGLINLHIHR